MSERMASSMVTGKSGRITSQAGMSYRYDLPRSPMNICRIHSRYCTQYGRSSPSSFMMAAFSDSFTYPAVENRMSTMSPGASRRRTKITIDMPMSVSTAIPSRWATYVFIRDGGPRIAPHTPQPSPRPGKAVARLYLGGARPGGPEMAPHTPQPSPRPGKAVARLYLGGARPGGPEMAPHTPPPSARPGKAVAGLFLLYSGPGHLSSQTSCMRPKL